MSTSAMIMSVLGSCTLIVTYITWRVRDLPRIRRSKKGKAEK